MRVTVNRATCLGMGICEALAPAVFNVATDAISVVTANPVPDHDYTAVTQAIASCPTESLHQTD